MSDQKYVNYYIEHAVGTAHDYLNTILQLKTQLRVANDAIVDKDGIISSLTDQLNTFRDQNTSLNSLIDELKPLESEVHMLRNKISHMDTLLNQINDMKRIIKERDSEIESLRIPVINTRKKPVKSEPTVLPNKPNEDF
jgi:predicted RNase H-like nuclease (RuvC/YqgF family)